MDIFRINKSKTVITGIAFLFFIPICFPVLAQEKTDVFKEQEVFLSAPAGNIYGTLTLPDHYAPGKAVLIISGSGPTDRNGNSILLPKNNDCFLKMAHQLAENGIASLRFDKRGVGASKKAITKEADLTFDTLVTDVVRWIDYLKSVGRFKEITIAGHSEGSLLGMIAAQKGADKYISICGAGFPADQIIKRQMASTPGIKDSALIIINNILDSLRNGHLVKKYPLYLMSLFRASVQPYLISWFKYDPAKEVEKLHIPILIIQGDNDMQVANDDAEKLHKANSKSKLVIIKDMTHTLRICTSKDRNENLKTYQNASMPLSEKLMNELIEFILK